MTVYKYTYTCLQTIKGTCNITRKVILKCGLITERKEERAFNYFSRTERGHNHGGEKEGR